MARTNPLTSGFLAALKQSGISMPYSILPKETIYEPQKHAYSLRLNTNPMRMRLIGPILDAIALTTNANTTTPFRLAQRRLITAGGNASTEYLVEYGLTDGSSIVVTANDVCDVRVSHVETDGTRDPIQAFKHEGPSTLAAIMLAILPHALDLDRDKAGGVLNDVVLKMGDDLNSSASWTGPNDVPDAAKDRAYFTCAIHELMNDHLNISFGGPSNSSAEEIPDAYFADPDGFSGAIVCENLLNGWTPLCVKDNGMKVKRGKSGTVTIAEAKAMFSSYTAHRKWTAQEKMMIPEFPDDAPVMPEVLYFAENIVASRDDIDPCNNIMWRSDTSYGKSYGTKQLAAILNIPLLIFTCSSKTEITDFKSSFVPASETEELELDLSSVVSGDENTAETADMPPCFEEAMANIRAMDEDQRKKVLDAQNFFMYASMDPEGAALSLIGSEQPLELEELCWLYSSVVVALREDPLKKKILRLEAAGNTEQKPSPSAPQFHHILSPYILALLNGYMVEVQEASRIRDSGVLVGLNEYFAPRAVISLMNGKTGRRHKDAICMFTDNVGYDSCRPIDPSVIRRFAIIVDSDELSKEELLRRAKTNTGCNDQQLLETSYELWNCVKTYCAHNSITDGSVSPKELERFVQVVHRKGWASIPESLDNCIISKATVSREDQRGIRTACTTVLTKVRVA